MSATKGRSDYPALASQTSSVVAEKATGPEVVSSASEISIKSLAKEIRDLIDGDRYFLSPRVRTLQEILHMIIRSCVREVQQIGHGTRIG